MQQNATDIMGIYDLVYPTGWKYCKIRRIKYNWFVFKFHLKISLKDLQKSNDKRILILANLLCSKYRKLISNAAFLLEVG